MKQKKIAVLFMTVILSVSLIVGCQNKEKQAPNNSANSAVVSDNTDNNADKNEAEANQLMADLAGTYQELWPVVFADDYESIWLNDSAALVGEEYAQAAVQKLKSMVTADIYGEEAVTAYTENPESMAYDCSFAEGLKRLTFDGMTISGVDEQGNALFSHTYHYIGIEELRGLYEFESDDADSNEFTYFFLAPDTSDTTYHIEFRYGADKAALESYDSGDYAYWLPSGISVDYDQTMIKNCIQLFCEENLAG